MVLGHDIPKLGFGLMRLPMVGDKVDIPQLKDMADAFLAKGFTYFDTAYGYTGGLSEKAVKDVLSSRYDRERYQLATKLPMWNVNEAEDMQRIFDEQLDRTGAGYFDFYLIHNINRSNIETVNKFDAWKFVREKKEEGKAKHIGFSFHDTAEMLDSLLTAHPEIEFVQLQINYADWDDDNVQSRKCYEVARKHGKPVIIMEPVKGGALATLAPTVRKVLTDARSDVSVASWAIRYAASLEGLITVLSGMSNREQMEDNLKTMSDFRPLSADERQVLGHAVSMLKEIPTIPCTGCKYCEADCPQKIAISRMFDLYNALKVYGNEEGAKNRYARISAEGNPASACLQCGSCESHCPQHIEIIEKLKDIAEVLE